MNKMILFQGEKTKVTTNSFKSEDQNQIVSKEQKQDSNFLFANTIWVFYTTLMIYFGHLVNEAYPVRYASSPLKNKKPVSTWTQFKLYQQTAWCTAWMFWFLSQFSKGPKIATIQLFTVLVVPLLSMVTNLIFTGLIYNGYSSSTSNQSADNNYHYLYVLPVTAVIDFMLARILFPMFITKSISILDVDSANDICYEPDGSQIDCWIQEVQVDQQQEEQSLEHLQEIQERRKQNGGYLWECEKNDTCGPPCAKYDKGCADGQPELFYTYVEYMSALKYMAKNKDRIREKIPLAELLQYYALVRQGMDGDLIDYVEAGLLEKPSFYDIEKSYKYSAWMDMEGTPRQTAQQGHIMMLKKYGFWQEVPQNYCLQVRFCDEQGLPTKRFYKKRDILKPI